MGSFGTSVKISSELVVYSHYSSLKLFQEIVETLEQKEVARTQKNVFRPGQANVNRFKRRTSLKRF